MNISEIKAYKNLRGSIRKNIIINNKLYENKKSNSTLISVIIISISILLILIILNVKN